MITYNFSSSLLHSRLMIGEVQVGSGAALSIQSIHGAATIGLPHQAQSGKEIPGINPRLQVIGQEMTGRPRPVLIGKEIPGKSRPQVIGHRMAGTERTARLTNTISVAINQMIDPMRFSTTFVRSSAVTAESAIMISHQGIRTINPPRVITMIRTLLIHMTKIHMTNIHMTRIHMTRTLIGREILGINAAKTGKATISSAKVLLSP